ncbi:la-related protein 4 [Genypterus blacodes]|uniref:la-related protein 4 n=1 Tax=Genypterus blacodes TaxID=154954 RepID=UPI003F764945
MVTTKGAGLNPNAKVWQEIPASQNNNLEEPAGSLWLETSPSSTETSDDGHSSGGKESSTEYPDGTDDCTPAPSDGIMNGLDFVYTHFDSPGGSVIDCEIPNRQPLSEGTLRESLKKRLEFCFSRENLSKDLYLISQMDSDHFVPIWTIACMEDIKNLTTDMDLILDVLRASPVVQVDEAGEKVRPNHRRCIIILREVPETTPVEDVEALFKSENCPEVLSVKFAHNSNWYITFQSDMDAQQAYRYLREEVKVFQGKPIMARIKAINTFFAKNGYHNVDFSVYNQHTQTQTDYASPVYMQQVYSPQQQYPVFPLVSPSWNPSHLPYFDPQLAPYSDNGFINGYSSPGTYKAGFGNLRRNAARARNHLKGHPRSRDVPPSPTMAPVPLMDGFPGPTSPQYLKRSGTPTSTTTESGAVPSFNLNANPPQSNVPSGDASLAGRGRRGSYRGTRRRREDERTTRPEVNLPPPPKFDLAASSFPPLPGAVVSTQGETEPEVRLSDVVRGLKLTNKSASKEVNETNPTSVVEDRPSTPQSVDPPPKPASVTQPVESPPASSAGHPNKRGDKDETSELVVAIPSSIESTSPTASEPPSTGSQPVSTAVHPPSSPASTSEPETRKLSYAEVCQRPAKDPPAAPMASPTPPASTDSQPLRELKDNKVEEPRPTLRQSADKPEKPGESSSPREPLRTFRGGNRTERVRGAGLKIREQQSGLATGKPFSPQRGGRRSGKEQNIPPKSPK